jgi:hypothetical protein
MLRSLALFTFATFAMASSSHAGDVQVNFSGGGGTPLTITLPQAVSFTVTNDTAGSGAVFVFQGVGSFIGGTTLVGGTLSYTANGGGATTIDTAGSFPLGAITSNDLSLFKNSNPVGLGLGDVLLLSSGSVTTIGNISAALPSGLYSAILVDNNGTQLGVGAAVPGPDGDYNFDGTVGAADYTVWRDGGSPDNTTAGYNLWKANVGRTAGAGTAGAIPEPRSWLMLMLGTTAVGWYGRTRRTSAILQRPQIYHERVL